MTINEIKKTVALKCYKKYYWNLHFENTLVVFTKALSNKSRIFNSPGDLNSDYVL